MYSPARIRHANIRCCAASSSAPQAPELGPVGPRIGTQLVQPVLRFFHAMAGGGGVKIARHGHVLGHIIARFVEFRELVLGDRMIGGGRGLQKRQGALGIRRSRLRPGSACRRGRPGQWAGPHRRRVHTCLRRLWDLSRCPNPAPHHRDVAHGGEILVLDGGPDLIGPGIIARVIGGDAAVECGFHAEPLVSVAAPPARVKKSAVMDQILRMAPLLFTG